MIRYNWYKRIIYVKLLERNSLTEKNWKEKHVKSKFKEEQECYKTIANLKSIDSHMYYGHM